MLKAMFKEFQALLGDDCALYSEFNPKVFRTEEILKKYKDIGVLYVNNGNLGKLPDGAMMEINYTLDLFMQVADTVNVADAVVARLENIATGTTGIIQTVNGGEGKYFLNTGLPVSDGAIYEGAGDYNYIRYELPVSVIFTKGIDIVDNKDVSVTIDGTTYNLKSVLSVVEVPQVQLQTNSFVNASGSYEAMQNESMVFSDSWSIQINKLYRSGETANADNDVALWNCIRNTPRKVVAITYKGVTHNVILHDCTLASELGQAAVMTINASTAMRGV